MIVFYGSQTGTAEEFAARLAKSATRYGMKAMVADPEECEMEDLSKLSEIENSIAVFCVATYGEGDPTDNAQEFMEWLNGDATDLSGIHYAVSMHFSPDFSHPSYVIRSLVSATKPTSITMLWDKNSINGWNSWALNEFTSLVWVTMMESKQKVVGIWFKNL